MKVARVFPTKTSYSPTDEDCYFDAPDLFTPKYDVIHISVTFTWGIEKAFDLKRQWQHIAPVMIGGPALGSSGCNFVPGMYVKKGVTFTTRGCNNNCGFCLVPKREGRLIELDMFSDGNVIQDNNFLQASTFHKMKVFRMLKTQKAIEFKGGLQASLITNFIALELSKLKIKSLWLACDTHNGLKPLKQAVEILQKHGFNRNKLMCYVLCGKDMKEETERMAEIFNIGCLPFAQLYRDEKDSIKYSKEWKQFARKWSRPAIIKSMCSTHQRGI